jgi:gamma-glutamyltranspeptidase / glutathione hydrolase
MKGHASGFGDAATTPHHLATQVAMSVMAAGGNAVDGAVAACAVQGVVAPETCGVGGDLFAIVHRPGMTLPDALNASGRAGSGAWAATLRDAGHVRIPDRDPLTVTVPGCVDGWQVLLERHGTLDLATVLSPAIRLALDGFPASDELAAAFERFRRDLEGQAAADGIYPPGRPLRPGMRVRRPGLAATLESLADDGREAFYAGQAGREIVAATGGSISPEDLARSQAEWVDPLGTVVFGLEGWTIPPNSQGYLTLAASRILELLDPPDDPDDPIWWHLVVEAYRSVAWERDDLVADPDHAPLPADRLLDPERLGERAARIDRRRASTWNPPMPAPGGTAYLCTMDRTGMGVSLIQSNYMGIGSLIGAGPAGFFLHNRGAGFDLRPGHPNELAPGKRPLHTLSPTLWTRGGDLAAVLGTRGGDQQPQMLLQVAARIFGHGTHPGDAQAAPRWTVGGFRQGDPPELLVEARTPQGIVDDLSRRGHSVRTAGPWEGGWGPVSVITVDQTGLRTAAADPRVATSAAGAA